MHRSGEISGSHRQRDGDMGVTMIIKGKSVEREDKRDQSPKEHQDLRVGQKEPGK